MLQLWPLKHTSECDVLSQSLGLGADTLGCATHLDHLAVCDLN